MDRWTIPADAAGTRLDKYLAGPDRLGSRARAADALRRGKVFLNERAATLREAAHALAAGDVVGVWLDRPGTARTPPAALGDDRDLPIVYEDDALVVLNKPAGVLAVPLAPGSDARSVFADLKRYLGRRRRRGAFVVHRIDRDTSGLVVFARNAGAQDRLKAQFKQRVAERIYLAVVYGQPAPASGTWRDRLVWDDRALIQKETHPRDPRGKDAVCHYEIVEKLAGASLIEVRLVTGRRNQIRLQARLHGHTLVGERRYTFGPDSLRPIAFPRQALHAHRLAFRHPVDERALRFEAPLPDDMKALIARLRPSRSRRH
jgi:23S rRNA pseudouridine1911/1915/1917 synthase